MRELWIALGLLSMGLGIIGIILPILPTTPFFLVTAYSFTKGSDRFSRWFHTIPFVQKHLTSLTMTKRKKWTLNITVDAILLTYFFFFDSTVLKITLITIILIKHIVFFKYVKTIKSDI